MDQFAFMVDTLTDYNTKFVEKFVKSDEELTNESLAMVESTLLHGYNIADVAEYQTKTISVTKRVN